MPLKVDSRLRHCFLSLSFFLRHKPLGIFHGAKGACCEELFAETVSTENCLMDRHNLRRVHIYWNFFLLLLILGCGFSGDRACRGEQREKVRASLVCSHTSMCWHILGRGTKQVWTQERVYYSSNTSINDTQYFKTTTYPHSFQIHIYVMLFLALWLRCSQTV